MEQRPAEQGEAEGEGAQDPQQRTGANQTVVVPGGGDGSKVIKLENTSYQQQQQQQQQLCIYSHAQTEAMLKIRVDKHEQL